MIGQTTTSTSELLLRRWALISNLLSQRTRPYKCCRTNDSMRLSRIWADERGQERATCFSTRYEAGVIRHRSLYMQVRTLRNTSVKQRSMVLKVARMILKNFLN